MPTFSLECIVWNSMKYGIIDLHNRFSVGLYFSIPYANFIVDYSFETEYLR